MDNGMEGVKENAQHYPKRNNTRNDPIQSKFTKCFIQCGTTPMYISITDRDYLWANMLGLMNCCFFHLLLNLVSVLSVCNLFHKS